MHTKHVDLKNARCDAHDQRESAVGHAPSGTLDNCCKEEPALGLFSEVVTAMRERFFGYLRGLPAPCGDDLIRHFSARLARSGGRPVLGEYAPFMLCDILGVPTQKVGEIAVPWLMLYETSALTDDLADLQVEDQAEAAFLLQFAFTEAMYCWRNYLEQFPFLWDELRRFQKEAVCAAYSELRDGHNRSGWQGGELAFGRKPALAKFCAAVLVALGKNRGLTREENEGLNQLCTAVQLLDDITDSESDLRLKQSNYVASAIVKWLRGLRGSAQLESTEITEEEAVGCLLLSGTLTRVAKFVVDCTHCGLDLLRVSKGTLTMGYFLSQVKWCERLLEEERRLRVECPDGIETAKRALSRSSEEYHLFLGTPAGAVVWQKMKECHSLMPRASQ